jgi:hypothetical protein
MGNYVCSLRRTKLKVTMDVVRGVLQGKEEIEFYPYQYLFKPPDPRGDMLLGAAHAAWKGENLPKYVMNGGPPMQESHDLKYAYELMERLVGVSFNDGTERKIGNVIGFVKWNSERIDDTRFLTCRDGLILNLEAEFGASSSYFNEAQASAFEAQINFLKSLPNEIGFQDGDRLKERLLDFKRGYFYMFGEHSIRAGKG